MTNREPQNTSDDRAALDRVRVALDGMHSQSLSTRTIRAALAGTRIERPLAAEPSVVSAAIMGALKTLTGFDEEQLEQDVVFLTDAVRSVTPGLTESQVRADQEADDLAAHLAYRPEVVAEVAVPLSDESDWEKIAAWCGGTIGSSEAGDSGEWDSWIRIPGVNEVATNRSWIVKRHDGTFDVRLEVEEPSEKSVAQIKADAWDECYSTAYSDTGTVVADPNNPYRALLS